MSLIQKIQRWLPLVLFSFAFLFTLLNLLSYTTLIGDDAAFHLADSLQTIKQEPLRTDYPILFRALLAPFLQLTGALELPEALLLFKILASVIASFNVLATFIYVKKALGFAPAILSAFLITISQKNMQMLGWGGLPNFTSLALYPIVLLIYLRGGRRSPSDKNSNLLFFLLILSSFLFHYWSGAILISIIAVYHLLTLKRERRSLILVFSLVSVLVLLLNFGPIRHVFKSIPSKNIFLCTQREAFIHLSLIWNEIIYLFGPGTFDNLVMRILAVLGFLLVIRRISEGEQERRFGLLLVSWLLVPLTLLFFITPEVFRNRFPYILTSPFYILISIGTTSILRYAVRAIKLLTLFLDGSKRVIGTRLLTITLTLLFTLPLILHGYGSINIARGNLQLFYPESSNAIIHSIKWAKDFTPQNSTIISTTWGGPSWEKGPSRWMMLTGREALRSQPILSDLVIEVTTENLRIYEGVYNNHANPKIEFHVVNPFEDKYLAVIGFIDEKSMLSNNNSGIEVKTPLSDFQERSIQILNQSRGETWIVTNSTYEQFALEKRLYLRNDSSSIELLYNITPNQRLEEACLTITSLLPNTTFNKVLLPGVLEWASPWNQPTDSSEEGGWASITSTSEDLQENLVAYTNSWDNILTVLRFGENKVYITANSTEGEGIHESTLTFPLGDITEGKTTSLNIELGFFNLRSRWRQIDMEVVNQLFETSSEMGEIEVKGLQETIELLSSIGPIYIMSEDGYLSSGFPDYTSFNRIYDNNYIVAYLNKK